MYTAIRPSQSQASTHGPPYLRIPKECLPVNPKTQPAQELRRKINKGKSKKKVKKKECGIKDSSFATDPSLRLPRKMHAARRRKGE
jgi:hypothetical protein